EVTQLAANQRVAVSADALTKSGSNIAAGTLTIGFGTAEALAANAPDSTKSVAFAGGTLSQLRDAINGANVGVTANIIDDGTTQRLVFSGDATGAGQAFTLSGLGLGFAPDAPGAEGDPVYRL